MKLYDGMLLYHGSYTEINQIDLEHTSSARDFGKGFYLTSSAEQAKRFINSSIRKAAEIGVVSKNRDYGFVTCFRYTVNEENLSVYEFSSADKDWLWYISTNRKADYAETIKKSLNENLFIADILIGKVANDNTNRVIAAYLNGLFGDILSDNAVNTAINQLIPEKLVDQYCFRTEKAIKMLQKVGAYKYDI